MSRKQKTIVLTLLGFVALVAATTPLTIAIQKKLPHASKVGNVHVHQWSEWGEPDPDNNDNHPQFIQFRHCTNCGLSEFRVVEEVK